MYKCSSLYLIGAIGIFPLSMMAMESQQAINQSTLYPPNHDQYIVVLKSDTQPMLVTLKDKRNYVNQQSEILKQALNIDVIEQYSSSISALLVQADDAQLALLKKNPIVDYVERNLEVSVGPVIDNLDLDEGSTQTDVDWGLDRIDQRDLPLDNQYDYQYDGTGVTAYIIDSGLTVNHEEFGGRASGYNEMSEADCKGHGTHVAGIIGSKTYGVAKNVKLVGLKVLNCAGKGRISEIIHAIDWVAGHGVRPSVVNLSLGSSPSRAEDAAIKALVHAGIQAIVAAGNDNKNACQYSPGREVHAFTVGATTYKDNRASFSNYGECVNIFAPGYKITSTYKGESNTATAIMNGTSMASPFVTGVAVLYLQEDPQLTPKELRETLLNRASVNKIGYLPRNTPNKLVYSLPSE
ncbi:S8 family peptidase [Parashewanella spongiae]|uniref:S8 family peptidase n=1 Tax=Parashewanella spongiae TaxID=342950 RepID=A0A3A6UJF1_9GAMM|nr:S8 family peptidase [Parashewanella spongiae]MCL1077862.1 S8 family peptidase [Parashewanella spongiae]RJY17618.1 S8 family peptidase [Parashewanella spongiae]